MPRALRALRMPRSGGLRLLAGVGASIALLWIVTGLVFLLRPSVPVLSLGVLYLFAVLPVAVAWGHAYAVPTAVVSMLVFNFFFLEPRHTFHIEERTNWLALAVYLTTALLVGDLAARVRRRAASDSVKTAILRAASHDLRSPLTAIRVAAESLASPSVTLTEEDRALQLETVRQESRRLDGLVANLLDLTRLEADAAVPQRELVAVDELVGQALAHVDANGRIAVRGGDDTPLVEVDPVQVERVLVNLLENALRYSPAGEQVVVEVDAREREAVVRVVDRGPGIPHRDLERIFHPFEQAATGDAHRGTGLGLAIARGFAEANGGRVWAEPNGSRGAALAVSFPRVHAS